MSEMLHIAVERFPTEAFYEQIAALREKVFYPSPFDARYWKGGIHGLRTRQQMHDVQHEDENSYFFLVHDASGYLKAYARISVRHDAQGYLDGFHVEDAPIVASKVHIILVSAEYQRKRHAWRAIGVEKEAKISHVLYEAIFDFCTSQRCNVVLADVGISPIPNLPSLALHAKMGFLPLALEPEVVIRSELGNGVCKINFLKLAAASGKAWTLQRRKDHKLRLCCVDSE